MPLVQLQPVHYLFSLVTCSPCKHFCYIISPFLVFRLSFILSSRRYWWTGGSFYHSFKLKFLPFFLHLIHFLILSHSYHTLAPFIPYVERLPVTLLVIFSRLPRYVYIYCVVYDVCLFFPLYIFVSDLSQYPNI